MQTPLVLVLCVASATFYVAAAAVMKIAGGIPFLLLLVPVFAALGLAAWFESSALATQRFGLVGLTILASEVLITAGAALALGERYSPREIGGLLLIVLGIVIVCHGEARASARPSPDAVAEPAARPQAKRLISPSAATASSSPAPSRSVSVSPKAKTPSPVRSRIVTIEYQTPIEASGMCFITSTQPIAVEP